ncbi:MAG TPA: AmmeMemoRadiSam system protein A [Candidatus Hydrogenedentes bacterium]|nr:AmmeMemoRadiSam system protein A [Candidatus Hydrogenedentota bacterium]HIJ74730.1 AmmeMemoRadiSam system protein A [Candidatus Hydrogenedentota bacterium]
MNSSSERVHDRLDHSEDYLTPQEERILLRIARDTLEACVYHNQTVDPEDYELTDTLRENHGAFVTLRIRGQLRGCIGYIANHEPLVKAVCDNTVNAATRDTRFSPVEPDEVDKITIEISALTPGDTPDTPFKRVHDVSEIQIGRDGLYIERSSFRGGILLPQVAVEQGWDVGQFLSAVCRKAGYPDRAWEEPGTVLHRFSAQVFSED